MRNLFYFLLLLPLFSGCKTDYANMPAFSGTRQMQAVIEIPAGSASVTQYDPETHTFPLMQDAGQGKKLEFLSFPGNYGFVPSTQFGKEGGLNVLVLGESREPGTLMEIQPLGVLLLEIKEELVYTIVAVPAKPSEQTLKAGGFTEFSEKYPAAKKIIELWFLHADPTNRTRLMGWKDEMFAEELVRKWMK
jgi:inorganic pyrophosphatase